MSMHSDNFLKLGQMPSVTGRHKGQRERWCPAQLGAHFLRDGAYARLVESVQDKAGNGAVHGGAP
jgi:hypothetical protein